MGPFQLLSQQACLPWTTQQWDEFGLHLSIVSKLGCQWIPQMLATQPSSRSRHRTCHPDRLSEGLCGCGWVCVCGCGCWYGCGCGWLGGCAWYVQACVHACGGVNQGMKRETWSGDEIRITWNWEETHESGKAKKNQPKRQHGFSNPGY